MGFDSEMKGDRKVGDVFMGGEEGGMRVEVKR